MENIEMKDIIKLLKTVKVPKGGRVTQVQFYQNNLNMFVRVEDKNGWERVYALAITQNEKSI